jgi:hypothetical protein
MFSVELRTFGDLPRTTKFRSGDGLNLVGPGVDKTRTGGFEYSSVQVSTAGRSYSAQAVFSFWPPQLAASFVNNKKETWLLVRRTRVARGTMAELSQFSIVTYERRPGYWRAAIIPVRRAGAFISGKTISSIVTPDDSASEPDAKFAAEKMIRKI